MGDSPVRGQRIPGCYPRYLARLLVWIALVASILIALTITHYKASVMKAWIGRGYFSAD
jgi:hypothetical protein